MSNKLAGAPAFPNDVPVGGGLPRTGITVRQYYKAAALTGLLACRATDSWPTAQFVTIAAQIADAMIDEDVANEENDIDN